MWATSIIVIFDTVTCRRFKVGIWKKAFTMLVLFCGSGRFQVSYSMEKVRTLIGSINRGFWLEHSL